jgi:hypothetical protein
LHSPKLKKNTPKRNHGGCREFPHFIGTIDGVFNIRVMGLIYHYNRINKVVTTPIVVQQHHQGKDDSMFPGEEMTVLQKIEELLNLPGVRHPSTQKHGCGSGIYRNKPNFGMSHRDNEVLLGYLGTVVSRTHPFWV